MTLAPVFDSKAEDAHALLSASSSHRWSTCAASLKLESALPNTSNKYSSEGTAAHTLASWTLTNGGSAKDYPEPTITADGMVFKVTPEMITAVDAYANRVRGYAVGGDLLVERRVDYSRWIGVPDSYGTSDAVVLHEDRVTIVDLKYGMGVKVDAVDNEQLKLYALGALYEYEMLGDFREVLMVICQPRLGHVSEFSIDVTDLKTFALNMKAKALGVMKVYNSPEPPTGADYAPSEEACRFCRAKATCPALAAEVQHETRDLFANLIPAEIPEDNLAVAMSKVGLIEDFCKAIRSEVERRLLAGQGVRGFKLVQGRQGNRAWTDPNEAEAQMKVFRLKQEEMYDFSLISPTTAEKRLSAKFPKRWVKLQKLISRADGKPSVAPETDKRPALSVTSVSDSFAALAASIEEVA